MTVEQDILGAIDAIFSAPEVREEDKAALAFILNEVKGMPEANKQQLSSYLLNITLPNDNPIPLYFFLFDCFGDVSFLEKLVPHIPSLPSISQFYALYWNISHRLFQITNKSALLQEVLRERFYSMSNSLRKLLTSRGFVRRQLNFDAPKNIAILSPQLKNMRHSPTREAYNIALTLEKHHNCNCYIFNTNAMVYKGDNVLNLVMPAEYNVDQNLQGLQASEIEYLEYKAAVKTVSFAAEIMSTQKLIQIINALYELKIEAVISHGENLLTMESIYQYFPSLFATTGSVVPYNHCDAYFIPGNLFNESEQHKAERYQHSEFMLESMLVTPEGKAQASAPRSQFGLQDNDFVYLVVGTRLVGEVDKEFVSTCEVLLNGNPNARIVFAGTPELELGKLFSDENSNRVINIGFQQDLPAISLMSDVYLNPKRAGGGTSAQTAILNGLPVVTLDHGHISAVVPIERRLENWSAYIEYANQLQLEPDYLSQEQQLYQDHFYSHLDAKGQIARIYTKLCDISDAME